MVEHTGVHWPAGVTRVGVRCCQLMRSCDLSQLDGKLGGHDVPGLNDGDLLQSLMAASNATEERKALREALRGPNPQHEGPGGGRQRRRKQEQQELLTRIQQWRARCVCCCACRRLDVSSRLLAS